MHYAQLSLAALPALIVATLNTYGDPPPTRQGGALARRAAPSPPAAPATPCSVGSYIKTLDFFCCIG
jgi:hypothetical protein